MGPHIICRCFARIMFALCYCCLGVCVRVHITCDSVHIGALEFALGYLEGLKGRLLFQGAQKLFDSHIKSLHIHGNMDFPNPYSQKVE